MPEEKKTVELDTSGPEVNVDIEEKKDEAVIEQPEQETEATEKETDKTFENERETKLDEKKDSELEDYSKGVQARIAKLTRKMREAERREKAALDYAKGVEEKRQQLESKFKKTDSDYIKKFETTISSGLEAAQKELAAAIEAGNAEAQVAANKRIATLAFENAKLEAAKEGRENVQAEKPVQNLSQGGQINQPAMDDSINTDPRIRVDFPHKFGKTDEKQSTAPVQTVASAKRSVKPGRKTVRLTSSQVAIAKKLGVPLEEYAKQLKNTEGA
jgi:hypothetical protein